MSLSQITSVWCIVVLYSRIFNTVSGMIRLLGNFGRPKKINIIFSEYADRGYYFLYIYISITRYEGLILQCYIVIPICVEGNSFKWVAMLDFCCDSLHFWRKLCCHVFNFDKNGRGYLCILTPYVWFLPGLEIIPVEIKIQFVNRFSFPLCSLRIL